MPNNIANPFILSGNFAGPNAVTQNPTTAYTVLSTDDVIVCGANSVAVTLTSTSNSPVYVTSVDTGTQRTGCTIVAGSRTWIIANAGANALCFRYGPASQNLWAIIGCQTGS